MYFMPPQPELEPPPNEIPIVDLTPVGRLADGSPIYSFHTSFPSRGVKQTQVVYDSPTQAWEAAAKLLKEYQDSCWPGGMGAVIGAASKGTGYTGVYITYYSNS